MRVRLALGVTIAALSSWHAGQAIRLTPTVYAQDATVLVPGATIERDLSTGQSHSYRLRLSAGDFVHLVVEQKGIDVAVTLVRPDGRELVAVDAMDDEFRPEVVAAIADVAGTYTLTTRPAAAARGRGRYSIRLDPPRPAVATDEIRVEAEQAFVRGRTRRDVNKAATWPEALADFNTARDRYRSAGDRRGEMKSLIEIAVTENYLSKSEALTAADDAERLARAIDDRPALARVLRVAASIHVLSGDLEAARQSAEEATAINRAIGHRVAEANSLNYTAIVLRRLGDLEAAMALYEQARPLARLSGDRALEANVLNNLGVIYSELDEHAKALSAYQDALAIARSTGNQRAQYNALVSVGLGLLALNQPVRARAPLLEALEIARQSGSGQLEANALSAMGQVDRATGDFAQSLDRYRTALAIFVRLDDLRGQAMAQHGAAVALSRLGRDDDAIVALQDAMAIWRQLGGRPRQRDVLSELARIERDRGDLDLARHYIQQSVDLDEALRGEITSPELRTTFAASEYDRYGILIDVLQRQHRVDAAGGHDRAALEVSERLRARALLESLLDARVDLRQDIEPALLDRERSLQKQLNDASAQLSRAVGRSGANNSAAAQTLDRLTTEYQQLQAQIRQQSPRYAAVMQPQSLTATDIQRSLIDDETVLLEFALGVERSWLWAITPDTLTTVELPPRREIDAATRSLYELITARQKRHGETPAAYGKRVTAADARLAGQAAVVSRMVLGGVADQLRDAWRTKRLAIVAGGALEYVPFAALPRPDPESATGSPRPRPLAAEHEIVMLPSASVLAVMRREVSGRSPAPRALAVIADPVFEATDPRVTATVNSSDTRDGVSRLPFSREEANGIAALAPATQVLKATDFAASRATVLSGALRGHRIVHFATHGIVNNERPSLSSLVLSLVDERGARQNGYLRLHDIYNMRLDADLVVLSACQTALGKEIKGEGLVGLARAFIYAGAPRVVASLWEVSDLATAELMTSFYRGMLQHHLAPAAALRAAQLQLSRDPRWAAPYFWAGFVLQGEYR